MGTMGEASGSTLLNGVRLVELELPEDEGEGLGFRLTRTLWDPYPWVREVVPGALAEAAGLRTGDCVLRAAGRDLLGLPVGQVAGLIRGDGEARSVTLHVWSCGIDPKEDPELLWSCGGGVGGERARRALSGVLRALACCVCAATASSALACRRSHLYCHVCWARLDRCALCRETLPAKDSPYNKNLVAEQVFEAIAKEYNLKDSTRRLTETTSAYTSPNLSPAPVRRGKYQISMMNKNKKTVQFSERFGQNYASDPNIHRSLRSAVDGNGRSQTIVLSSTNLEKHCQTSNSTGNIIESQQKAQKSYQNIQTQTNSDENTCGQTLIEHNKDTTGHCSWSCLSMALPHRLALSRSLNNVNLDNNLNGNVNVGSLDSLKNNCGSMCGSPVVLLPVPPIYVFNCDSASTTNDK